MTKSKLLMNKRNNKYQQIFGLIGNDSTHIL